MPEEKEQIENAEAQAEQPIIGSNIVKAEQSVTVGSPDRLIELALSQGADLDKLEKILALKERYDAGEAKKKYNKAMVEVHKNIPIVAKALQNQQTHSTYASLDGIISKTKVIYTEHGFSISFYEGETTKENHIRICADVIHAEGHKETYYYDVPLDGKGIKGNVNMTPIHAKASSVSYSRRYLMCMIWNIPTGDDDDGNAAGNNNETITDEQAVIIDTLVKETETDPAKFLIYISKMAKKDITSYNEIPAKVYINALSALNAKKRSK